MPKLLLAITLITLIASLALYLAHRLAKGRDPRVDCPSGFDDDWPEECPLWLAEQVREAAAFNAQTPLTINEGE